MWHINAHTAISDPEVNDEIVRTFNLTSPFKLEDFTYTNYKLLEIIFEHLANTSFDGLTVRWKAQALNFGVHAMIFQGTISFAEDGIREISNLLISQFRNGSY